MGCVFSLKNKHKQLLRRSVTPCFRLLITWPESSTHGQPWIMSTAHSISGLASVPFFSFTRSCICPRSLSFKIWIFFSFLEGSAELMKKNELSQILVFTYGFLVAKIWFTVRFLFILQHGGCWSLLWDCQESKLWICLQRSCS